MSNNQKKEIGNFAEGVVEKYLKGNPAKYSNIEQVSKTNEGAHYDIKFFDMVESKMKYIECKYYNGVSFYISQDQKTFAFDHLDQYEIWLVNNESQIYPIKDIRLLGELEPANYRIYYKVEEHAQQN